MTTVARTRGWFTRASYLLEVQVETYKVQSRIWGKLTNIVLLVQRYKNKGPGDKESRGTKDQGAKGELASREGYLSKALLYTILLVFRAGS